MWKWEPERGVGTGEGFGVGSDTTGTAVRSLCAANQIAPIAGQDHRQGCCRQTSLVGPARSLLLFVHLFLFPFLR